MDYQARIALSRRNLRSCKFRKLDEDDGDDDTISESLNVGPDSSTDGDDVLLRSSDSSMSPSHSMVSIL